MPIQYRQSPKSSTRQSAAYIKVIWVPANLTFYGGLLLVDAAGQPLEFVHNTLVAPSGFLWPVDQVQSIGVAKVCHSLFKACQLEPLMLLCDASLGSVEYCKVSIAPLVPCARVERLLADDELAWSWVNSAPAAQSQAYMIAEDLRSNGFACEPFERVARGLEELYPNVPWPE